VMLHSGEVRLQAVDLVLPGQGLDFVWARTYRSRVGANSTQGQRWTHSYDVRCVQNSLDVDVYDGTGRYDTFRLQADGTYACPALFREGIFTGGVFRLTFADTGFWEFRALDRSPAAGKLARIQDRNGNALTLDYDGEGRLAHVTDTLGRVHTVAYTAGGRVASVTDSTGRTVSYAYYAGGESGGAPGGLKSATSPPVTGTPNGNDFPAGKTTTYTYSSGQADPRANHLLLTVVSPLGQTSLTCAYDLSPASPNFQRCVQARRASHSDLCLSYFDETSSADNRFAVRRCVVNDSEGNVSECLFDLRNRCVVARNFTGRATPGLPVTDSSNRPTDKLRDDDPDLFQSVFTWNRDSLLVGGALPGGNVLSFVHEGDLNPFARPRKRADLRTCSQRAIPGRDADSDGDGVPDIAELTASFTYDPRFGTDPTCPPCTPFRRASTAVFGMACTGGPDDDGDAGLRVLPTVNKRGGAVCDTTHFFVSQTDPNGTTSSAEYDERGNCTSFIVNSHNQPVVQCAYDAHGQLTAYTHPADAAGRSKVDAFTWHQGLVTQVVEDAASGGLRLTTGFERDGRGNVTRVIDPLGNDVLITYNALSQPVRVAKQTQGATFGERVRCDFAYDADNNLVGVAMQNRGPDGSPDADNPTWDTAIAYDALHRPTLLAHELAHTVQQRAMTNEFVYDGNGNITLHRLPEAVSGAEPDNVVACAYDERGRLFLETRAPATGLSTVDRYDYDANGNLRRVSKIDAFTIKQTRYRHDGFDRCVQTLDANSNVATRCYDRCGNLTYERADGETTDQPGGKGNRKLAEVRYRYDLNNVLTNRAASFFDIFTEVAIGRGKTETGWAYAPNGRLTSVTDDSGHATTFAYDSAGRLTSVTDPRGNAASCTYDPNGNVLTATQADLSDVSAGVQRFVRTFAYDALGRCVGASDNVGNAVAYAYDSRGQVAVETDPAGSDTAYAYDGLGRVVSTVHYDGAKERGITINTSHVEYRNARLVSATDANGNATAFVYDACDRRILTTFADGTSEALVWSPRSNLARVTDANGTTITNTYDACDRLVRRDIVPGAGVEASTTFETFAYDGLGRLVSAENDASTLTWAYDSLGNRVACTQDGFAASATYDGLGNRLTLTCPSGRILASTYDALNRVSSIGTLPFAGGALATLATFAYDGPDRLAKVTRANGVNTRLFWDGQQGAANAPGDYGWQQVARVNHARAGGGLVVDQRAFAYDRSQNKVLRAQTAPWAAGGSLVTNVYGYDKLHRLTRARKSGSIVYLDRDYVYDANGNRLQVTNNGLVDAYAMDATLPWPADAQMNQYTDTPFGTDGYDGRGNRVIRANSARSTFYRYDYADRLVQVDGLDPSDPMGTVFPVATYSYDPLGRRIGKTVYSSGGLPPVVTTYVYDDCDDGDCDDLAENSLLETHENGALKRTHVAPHVFESKGGYARTHVAPHVFETRNGMCAFITAAGDVVFHHADDLGNTLALTDAAGEVVERCDYDDFGAPSFFNAAGAPQTSSASGNDLLFRGMRWDAETGLYSGSRKSSPLYDDQGREVHNPLYGSQRTGAQNNPYFVESSSAGEMASVAGGGGGGGVTWHECFICFAMDPGTGQTLGRDGSLAGGGSGDRSFANNNPWSSEPPAMKSGTVKFFNETKGFGFMKEEGGRHTPFHNKYRPQSAFRSVSNVLKTKHDTAKNSIGNIR
jgi:YD repeat-containing protein